MMSGIFRDLVSRFNPSATLINPQIRDGTTWYRWLRKRKAYQYLAGKIAINAHLSLTAKSLAGSCVLLCFGISLETIQLMVAWCYSLWDGGCCNGIRKRDLVDFWSTRRLSHGQEEIHALGEVPPV
jgi:hypothetical protein